MVGQNSGCPYCSGQKVIKGLNDLTIINPELIKEWNYDRNIKKPNEFLPNSSKIVWWKCEKGHEWEEKIAIRNKGIGCPYCSNRRVLVGFNDLSTTNPTLAQEWHPVKNRGLTSMDVTQGSETYVWWQCKKGHEWQALIKNRSLGSGCPICKNKKILIGYNDLKTRNPNLAKEWNYNRNGGLTPEDYTQNSGKKVWWQCEKGHEWEAVISSRNRGTGCPICTNQKVLVGYNDLATTHPELLSQWNFYKNKKLPQEFTSGSNKKVWWKCDKEHEWIATINSRVNGTGCPKCASNKQTSFPEQAIYFYLKKIDSGVLSREKINGKIEVDIFIPSLNIAIEFDGEYFHKGLEERERRKNLALTKEKIRLIRVKEITNVKNIEVENDIIFFSRTSNYVYLNKAILTLIDLIWGLKSIKIDIKRDKIKILEQYKLDDAEKNCT